ncbi:MAG: glycosyltransferase family 4 protein [Candidatus Peregrinibacteria bacterium]|nr:glycosyltransferase family 4 protein [Candidatus Peregrinibacteria bacterium]
MKILLATGIYPPDIGGPATYVRALAEQFTERGHEVTVVTYGEGQRGQPRQQGQERWNVVTVGKHGGPILRWLRYARALREHGKDADIVYAFSSVSCGMPLAFASALRAKKVLRLGGDFFWERYTDGGGMQSLTEWYASGHGRSALYRYVLHSFDAIVFSTRFQQELYERSFKDLPRHTVIENALPAGKPVLHQPHSPLHLLFVGRLVAFKNLLPLLRAVTDMSFVLTIVGDGPMRPQIEREVAQLGGRVTLRPPVHGEEKARLFAEHDLLVLPSITELSPNVALEARSAGLPVLITQETGLSAALLTGMQKALLRTPEEIGSALQRVGEDYKTIATEAASPLSERMWEHVAEEHERFFTSLPSKA